MKPENSWFLVVGVVLALALASPAAAATDDDKTVSEKILDILLERGDISQDRYDELREEALAEKEPGPTEWTVKWDNGTKIERNDGKFKVKIGGRIQYDFAGTSLDGRLKSRGLGDEGTGTDVRRARVFISGEYGGHGIFKAQYDFAGSDTDFKDVYAGLKDIPVLGTVRAGHFKEPQSLEMTSSSKYISFLERGLPVLAFTSERNAGVGFHRSFLDGRVTLHAGGFQDVGDDAEEFDNQGNYQAGFRVTGLPIWEDDGETALHAGAWYSHQWRNGELLQYDPDAESNTLGSVLEMPVIDVDGVDLLGVELAYQIGSFYAQGEFIAALVDGDSGFRDSDFYGSYLSAGYFLTGERRKYDRKMGAIGRTKVLEPFDLGAGQWGGLEVAARWSYLTLNDGSVRGGVLNDYTVGVNWYLYSNLRLMFNYVLAHRNGVGQAHVAQSRVSLDF